MKCVMHAQSASDRPKNVAIDTPSHIVTFLVCQTDFVVGLNNSTVLESIDHMTHKSSYVCVFRMVFKTCMHSQGQEREIIIGDEPKRQCS